MVGVECLSRFDMEPRRTPDLWFKAAHAVGLGMDLELRAIQNAVCALDYLPRSISLSINCSPELITSGRLDTLLSGLDLTRIVVEITEHACVEDYQVLQQALAPLRTRGVQLAIDDAGAGYASMRHILNLKADIIKLDMSLTRNIDTDASRRALAKGLIAFAHEINTDITAEGVETAAELATLRTIGVDKVQGYYLSTPRDLNQILVTATSVHPKLPPDTREPDLVTRGLTPRRRRPAVAWHKHFPPRPR
jgi:EAL domain-containing protein (putative c-di-GMP-specific phosphodiesterase class I)